MKGSEDKHSFDHKLAPLVGVLVAIGRPLLHELAKELVELMNAGAVDHEIDQRSTAALRRLRLTPRGYLEAARKKGTFASKKRGRRIVARLRDVEAWRNRPPAEDSDHAEPARATADDEERVLLGLRPKGALRVVGGKQR
ncbi:MAG TPA: hypothetical protein VK540_26790 [Polyangiaceae bacterium]|nr:hypothetical protein [Polyangiaceae bacterium]